MRSLVTSELFRALPAHRCAVLRFNFRGVGASGGEHGDGVAERLDVVAALDALADAVPGRPLVVAGWSFGADVALTVDDARLAGWVLIAPPLRVVAPEAMVAAHDPRPKLLIVPERDQFRPPDSAAEATAGWTNTRLEVIPGADHFLAGRTARATELVVDFAAGLVSRSDG
jgi:alpha/beta superfamily hydrolase